MRSLNNREWVSVRERLDAPALGYSIFLTSVQLGILKQADCRLTLDVTKESLLCLPEVRLLCSLWVYWLCLGASPVWVEPCDLMGAYPEGETSVDTRLRICVANTGIRPRALCDGIKLLQSRLASDSQFYCLLSVRLTGVCHHTDSSSLICGV